MPPLTHVTPGTPFQPLATDHNAFVDAALAHQRSRLDNNTPPGHESPSQTIVQVKNDSGGDRSPFDVLAADTMQILPSALVESGSFNPYRWQDSLLIRGKSPDLSTSGDHWGRGVILLESIADGAIGKGLLAGYTICRLDVGYANHRFADIADGSHDLTSNWYGSWEILYRAELTLSGDNEWWGLIRHVGWTAPEILAKVDDVAGIPAGGSGTVTIWDESFEGDPVETSPKQQVEAHYDWFDDGGLAISNGKELLIRFERIANRWRVIGADCE